MLVVVYWCSSRAQLAEPCMHCVNYTSILVSKQGLWQLASLLMKTVTGGYNLRLKRVPLLSVLMVKDGGCLTPWQDVLKSVHFLRWRFFISALRYQSSPKVPNIPRDAQRADSKR